MTLSSFPGRRKRLAVCAIFENVARFLPEWLAFHSVAGVDHFVLYDNASTDNPETVIRSLPLSANVTLIRWPQRPGKVTAYRHFIDIFAPAYDWAAFLDPDQFLLPLNGDSLMDVLDGLGDAAAVLVQRRVFAPAAGGLVAPRDLLIETCVQRAADGHPLNRLAVTIARCSTLQDVTQNPHEFRVTGAVVNAAGDPVANAAIQAGPYYVNLAVNQYCMRPAAEWLAGLPGSMAAAGAALPPEQFDADGWAALSAVSDVTVQRFAPAVRSLLGLEAASRPAAAAEAAAAAEPPGATSAASPGSGPDQSLAPAQPETDHAEDDVSDADAARSAPPGAPADALPPSEARAEIASGWLALGEDARERVSGLAFVFRDRSRAGQPWLAALRGAAHAATDPAFLTDEFERIRDFATDAEAQAACDAVLARGYSF